jgi:hypothetical protein
MNTFGNFTNATPSFSFYDEVEMIEYMFSGFDQPLSLSEKIELIKEHGTPRSRPIIKDVTRNGFTINIADAYANIEKQSIHKVVCESL